MLLSNKLFTSLEQLLSHLFLLSLLIGCLSACSHNVPHTENGNKVGELSQEITLLSPEISFAEAEQTSRALMTTAKDLANEYRMASPPRYHNLLVHMGLRKRGLCCHWAEDLHTKLRELSVNSLKFDWLVAKQGKLLEHSSIVIYPAKLTWKEGIVFDPWRKSGIPYWTTVNGDEYHWKLHPLNGQWNKLRCK